MCVCVCVCVCVCACVCVGSLVAQWLAQCAATPEVGGSNPTRGKKEKKVYAIFATSTLSHQSTQL